MDEDLTLEQGAEELTQKEQSIGTEDTEDDYEDFNKNAEEVRFALRKKIVAYEKELHELVIKRPTGKEFEKLGDVDLQKINYKNMFRMVMVGCNLPRHSVHQMDAADVMKAGMIIVNFLGSSLPDGGSFALI